MENNLGKQSGESVGPVEDPPPAVVPTQDQSTSESLVDSSGQQQPRPQPPLSPLTGCYLLIIVGEPHSERHKEIILQKIAKAFLSWDVNQCHVSLEKELEIFVNQAPEGEEARFGEKLIQYATENLVTEILIHPQLNTLHQCMKNLLSSFTKHRHIVHAGYTFAGNGSWILQDGTLSVSDLVEALHEPEVIRVLKAYGNSVSIDVHCASEGDWTTERFQKEPASKLCAIRINPGDVMTAGNPAISSFINYLSPFLVPANIQQLLKPTDVVGNIRFTHPTLYVFPGGQGDAALFGINGFNMLVDGGFARKACFWDFARHLDRLDAVLLTRLNNSTVNGISAVLQRKKMNHVYPQIGHFFCNLQDRKIALSPDGDKDRDSLIVNLAEEGQEIVANLRHLALKPHPCYRDGNQVDPVNLYHKVGHGKLDMYVISPARDSQAVKEFLAKWSSNDSQLFSNTGKKAGGKAFEFPLQNLVSICALLVWQPANPNDTITRILFPGSTPQHKIFEGLEKLRHLEFLKHPVCTARSISPSSSAVSMTRSVSKTRQPKPAESKVKETKPMTKPQSQPQPRGVKPKVEKSPPKEAVKESGAVVEEKKEIEKAVEESPKKLDNRVINKDEQIENIKDEIQKIEQTETEETKKKIVHKSKYDMKNVKPKVDSRAPSRSTERKKVFERKPGGGWPSPPGTPKKAPLNGNASKAEKAKVVATPKPIAKPAVAVPSSSSAPSPPTTPAKSAKEANNRKVVEARVSSTKSSPKTAPVSQKKEGTPPSPLPQPPPAPVHRRQPNRRPKPPQSQLTVARATRRVIHRPNLDPLVVKTFDPSIDVELGLGVDALKTEIVHQRRVDPETTDNEETDAPTVIVEMDAAQAEAEEVKLKRDQEETEDIETEEAEEYLIITRQEYGPPYAEDVKENVVSQETKEEMEGEMEKLLREEKESEKNKAGISAEKDYKPIDEKEKDEQEREPEKEEIKEKAVEEDRVMSDGKESEVQKLADVDEGIDLKEPASKEPKEGESLPEEKISNTLETSATTAPTLPEDERIEEPMIDETNIQQDETKEEVVEEKYIQEETKEDKRHEMIEDDEAKQPTMLPNIDAEAGIPTQKKVHPRDVVKTPDEVADLPMHEEVDAGMYSSGDFTKEMQKKTEEDKTLTEKKLDVVSPSKEKAILSEEDYEASEKSEESKKAMKKEEKQITEEKDDHGDSITSQYLNIIDKLEKSASESKKDLLEDIKPEKEDDKITTKDEIVEGKKEDEKTLDKTTEPVLQTEEHEIPDKDKVQPQDVVTDEVKRSQSPTGEKETIPKTDEKVSVSSDLKTTSQLDLTRDLSGKTTPQEPEVISGKSSPLVLGGEASGKATPQDLEKESSGKATPADLGKAVSGKSTPQDLRKDSLQQETSGKSTPLDLEVANRRHSLLVEKELSGKSTPLDSVSGKSSPQDVGKGMSGKSSPQDLGKGMSDKSSPQDVGKGMSGKSSPLELAKDLSGKSSPLEVEGRSSRGSASREEEHVSIKSGLGTEKDDSERSEPSLIAEKSSMIPQESGEATPHHVKEEMSPGVTHHDLEVKVADGRPQEEVSRGPSPQEVSSGKVTPIDVGKSERSTPQDIKRSSITKDVISSGKVTPSEVEIAVSGKSSRRESRESTVEVDSDRRSSLQSVMGEEPVEGHVATSSGKLSPLAKETSKISEEQPTRDVPSRKGSSGKETDEEIRKQTPEDQEMVKSRKGSFQEPSGKITPSDVTESETAVKIESYEIRVPGKDQPGKMAVIESSISDSASSGPPEKDVSGKSTPFSTDKETSALGGKATSDSFSLALADKGTSGTYSLEKESGGKSSSPSPVDISPLSLDDLKETPKERKAGEIDEKDVITEDELEETVSKEEQKFVGEISVSSFTGKDPTLERIKLEGGESSGTSSPDRSRMDKSEGSLPNGTESEEECEKGILESEKQEKESQILDLSSGEEEELKALDVDDDDAESETETRKRLEGMEGHVEVAKIEEKISKAEKTDAEKLVKTETEAEGIDVEGKAKVKRMLITASSEDGGTETEICIQDTAKVAKKEAEEEVVKTEKAEEKEEGDFSNLILQAQMEYKSQRSRKSSYNSSPEDAEDRESVMGEEYRNGEEKKGGEGEEEEEEELGTLLMQARQELAFVRSKSRESKLDQGETRKLEKTTTTTRSESTKIDDDNDIITITTILTEEREEQEDGSIKVTTTKETTTSGGKEQGTVVTINTEYESKKTEEEKSQVNSATSESGQDKERSAKGDGEGKTSQEEITAETSRRTSASSIISQEDLVSRKDSAKIEDFRQSSTEMSPLKTTYITSHGDSESLMTSSFYGNLPTEDEMIGKSERQAREFRRGRGYESVTEVGPNGERTERSYFYGTEEEEEEDPTKVGRDISRYVKAYYTEEGQQQEGEHSRFAHKQYAAEIPEEEGTIEKTRFVQHYYKEEEEEEPKLEAEEGKFRFVQTFSGEGSAEHVDFAKAIDEHISARGEYLGKEIRQDVARYTNGGTKTEGEDGDDEDEGSTTSTQEELEGKKKDVIKEWGKPLGLPLPPRNKAYAFPRQNISTTSSLSTPTDTSDSVSNWGQPMSLPSPVPPSVQNGVVETLPGKSKESSKVEKKVHMKKNISGDNKSSGNNTPNRRSESPIKQAERRTPSTGRSGRTGGSHLYLDLTYVPHHGNSYYSNVEFFKKIRARYYVFSGTEPSKEVYNALLEAKQTWEDKKLEVTIIPTYDTDVLGYWVAENEEILAKNKIDLSPSASRCTINLQDHETSCSAYRLEF